jgi:hypothetical protein
MPTPDLMPQSVHQFLDENDASLQLGIQQGPKFGPKITQEFALFVRDSGNR